MSGHVLEVDGVTKSFRTPAGVLKVLDGVSLCVPRGKIVALTGRSGSGKTTLLQIMGLLLAPNAGTVVFADQPTAGLSANELARLRRERLGFVFQSANLLPQHSAIRNVMIPSAGGFAESRVRAEALLNRVGLGSRLYHRPDQLSVGEQQRAAIARSLINDPEVILADEPTGSLDHTSELEILDIFQQISAEGHSVVVVTHNEAVSAVSDVRLHLQDGVLNPERSVR